MPVENHGLSEEFPELRSRIHTLKMTNSHFSKLFNRYDALDHEIRHIENGAAAASDAYIEQLKKERLHLKDELFSMLKEAA